MWEPYFTTKGTTGLGLPVARAIIETHGGTLEGRNNEKGPGAVFIGRIPLEQKKE